jgi:hypothetical protein
MRWPFTTSVTSRVVPLEIPRCTRGEGDGDGDGDGEGDGEGDGDGDRVVSPLHALSIMATSTARTNRIDRALTTNLPQSTADGPCRHASTPS